MPPMYKTTKVYKIKRSQVIIGLVCAVLLFLFWRIHQTKADFYYSCTQAKADGHVNIKKSDPLYNPQLDRDSDGVACEV